jgi:hypothetical protein
VERGKPEIALRRGDEQQRAVRRCPQLPYCTVGYYSSTVITGLAGRDNWSQDVRAGREVGGGVGGG